MDLRAYLNAKRKINRINGIINACKSRLEKNDADLAKALRENETESHPMPKSVIMAIAADNRRKYKAQIKEAMAELVMLKSELKQANSGD